MQFRYDTQELKHWELTDEGFIRFCAPISREGDLVYRDSAGGNRIETVRRDTLIKSANSFKLKPLTLNHPPVPVSPENAKQYQVGTIGHGVYFDNGLLWMTGAITDKQAIDAVVPGEARQISAGYQTKTTERSDGRFEQVERIGNHVSLVPLGRAGVDVAIRLDGYDDVAISDKADDVQADPPVDLTRLFFRSNADEKEREDTVKYKFTLDGIGFETEDLGIANAAKAVNEKLSAVTSRADAAEKEKSTLEGTIAGLQTEVKTVKDAAEKDAETRLDADEVSTQVTLRLDAWGEVLPFLRAQDAEFKPDYKLDEIDVKRLYLGKRTDADLTNKDAAFIEGMYAALKPPTAAEVDEVTSGDRVDSILDVIAGGRQDAGRDPVEERRKARADRIKNNGKSLMGGAK